LPPEQQTRIGIMKLYYSNIQEDHCKPSIYIKKGTTQIGLLLSKRRYEVNNATVKKLGCSVRNDGFGNGDVRLEPVAIQTNNEINHKTKLKQQTTLANNSITTIKCYNYFNKDNM
jgi:hypothetical protein